MAKAAQNEELAAAFEKHERETEAQVDRLEQVFGFLEETPRGKNCPAILGLIEEGKEIMDEYKRLMPGCWPLRNRWNTTKYHVMARLSLGPTNSACPMPFRCSKRRSTKRKPPTRR
jgi:Domain of unknown function (DUF892)